METVGSVYQKFITNLSDDYEPNEARQVASIVFENTLGLSRIDLATKGNSALSDGDLNELNNILSELLMGMPVQYIIGHVWFHELKLKVNENVLIPRRETEELVEWIIRDVKSQPETIIDYCTGSGCIALALKKAFPAARVIGIDLSERALEVAAENARINSIDVEWIRMNVLENDSALSADIIVSNPPYVMLSEGSLMSDRVRKFEPYQALFVEDIDPLAFYRRISSLSLKNSAKMAVIYYEINEAMGLKISELHSQLGFTDYLIKKDLQEKDRFFKTSLPEHSL